MINQVILAQQSSRVIFLDNKKGQNYQKNGPALCYRCKETRVCLTSCKIKVIMVVEAILRLVSILLLLQKILQDNQGTKCTVRIK